MSNNGKYSTEANKLRNKVKALQNKYNKTNLSYNNAVKEAANINRNINRVVEMAERNKNLNAIRPIATIVNGSVNYPLSMLNNLAAKARKARAATEAANETPTPTNAKKAQQTTEDMERGVLLLEAASNRIGPVVNTAMVNAKAIVGINNSGTKIENIKTSLNVNNRTATAILLNIISRSYPQENIPPLKKIINTLKSVRQNNNGKQNYPLNTNASIKNSINKVIKSFNAMPVSNGKEITTANTTENKLFKIIGNRGGLNIESIKNALEPISDSTNRLYILKILTRRVTGVGSPTLTMKNVNEVIFSRLLNIKPDTYNRLRELINSKKGNLNTNAVIRHIINARATNSANYPLNNSKINSTVNSAINKMKSPLNSPMPMALGQ